MKNRKLSILLLIAGLSVFFYPDGACFFNARRLSAVSARYLAQSAGMDEAERERSFTKARAFNARLCEKGESRYFLTEEEEEEYSDLLASGGDGLMGVIAIEKIGLTLPIYHGVDEDTLRAGIGHVPGSSLPVGAPGEHVLLSGHTGMASSELFTRLCELEEGDRFTLTVLGLTMRYRVVRRAVVLPDQTRGIEIEAGRDQVTLITCTPYGVNSHRLLVTGEREEEVRGAEEVSDSSFPLLLALSPYLLSALITPGLLFWKKRRRYV